MPSPTAIEGTMDYKTTSTAAPKLVLEAIRTSFDLPSFPLAPGRYTVGSSPDCDVVLPVAGVAEQHCLIIVGASRTIVKALSPLTWINDGPVTEAVLSMTARLILGPVELRTRRPEVSEWLGATEAKFPVESAKPHYQPPRINELLEQARTHLQEAIDDLPPAESRPAVTELSAPVTAEVSHVHPVQEPPLVILPVAAPEEQTSLQIEQQREVLAQRELTVNERARSLDYLGSELAQLEQRLLRADQELIQREIAIRENIASEIDRTSALETREASLLAETRQIEQAQQALHAQRQTTEELSTTLENRWREIEERATQLDAREREIREHTAVLDQRQQAVEASARQTARSLAALPAVDSTMDLEELTRRESVVTRREATLAESVAALNATRQQLAEESVQLEARFEELASRERSLFTEQTQSKEHTAHGESQRRELAAAAEAHHQRQQIASATEAKMAQQEAALADREAGLIQREQVLVGHQMGLESRERELRGLRSEFDIREEALQQQFSQLQLDRAALRTVQAKWQSMEQSLVQREQTLASRGDQQAEIDDRAGQLTQREVEIKAVQSRLELREQALVAREVQLQKSERELTSLTHQQHADLETRLQQFAEREAELEAQNANRKQREQQLVASEHALLSQQGELSRSEYEMDQLLVSLQRDRDEFDQQRLAPLATLVDPEQQSQLDEARIELETLRASLLEERSRLKAEAEQVTHDQAALESERSRWTATQLAAPQTSASEDLGERLQAVLTEREVLREQTHALAEQQALFQSEQLESRQRASEIERQRAEFTTLKAEAVQERDTYLIERQAMITERQALQERERAVQKIESDALHRQSENAAIKEEFEIEQGRMTRQRNSLTTDWEELRREQTELESLRQSFLAEQSELRQQSADIDSQRDELQLMVSQFSALQDESASPSLSVAEGPQAASVTEPVVVPEPSVEVVTEPIIAPQESVATDSTQEEETQEEESEQPDELAGFASFSSIDSPEEDAIPFEVASLLGIPTTAKPKTATQEEPHSSKVAKAKAQESVRLIDLLRRPTSSIIDEAAAQSPGDEEFEVVSEEEATIEIVEEHHTSEQPPVSRETSPGKAATGSPEDVAIRTRLSEMFGINLDARPAQTPFNPQAQPEPSNAPAARPTAAATLKSKPTPAIRQVAVEPDPVSTSNDSIATYMEQLLARTRKSPAAVAAVVAIPAPAESIGVAEGIEDAEAEDEMGDEVSPAVAVEEPWTPPDDTELEPEEYQRKSAPQNKETQRANLDSFRTIANSKARSDLAVSEYKRLRLTIQVKQVLLYVCCGVAVVMIIMQFFGQRPLLLEMIGAGVACAFLGWDYWKTKQRLRELQMTAGVGDGQLDGEVPDSLNDAPDAS